MKIKRIEIEYIRKDGFTSASVDGLRHVKTYPYISVVQSLEGSYDIQLAGGEKRETGEGGFFITPSHIRQTIVHHVNAESKTMVCRWIFMRVKLNERYSMEEVCRFPVTVPESHQAEMHAIFERLFAVDDPFTEHVCAYEIARLLYGMSEEKGIGFPAHIDRAIDYMRENYRKRISVAELARAVNLSPSYFLSLFGREMDISPIAYLNSYRLSLAADLLLKTDKTIVEIAGEVGIADSVYFNKLFRRAYQIAPSRYRQIYRDKEE